MAPESSVTSSPNGLSLRILWPASSPSQHRASHSRAGRRSPTESRKGAKAVRPASRGRGRRVAPVVGARRFLADIVCNLRPAFSRAARASQLHTPRRPRGNNSRASMPRQRWDSFAGFRLGSHVHAKKAPPRSAPRRPAPVARHAAIVGSRVDARPPKIQAAARRLDQIPARAHFAAKTARCRPRRARRKAPGRRRAGANPVERPAQLRRRRRFSPSALGAVDGAVSGARAPLRFDNVGQPLVLPKYARQLPATTRANLSRAPPRCFCLTAIRR